MMGIGFVTLLLGLAMLLILRWSMHRNLVWHVRRDKSRDRKGTGLGLAIARQIVQLHGGSCYVKNTETGVEFGVKLPH